MEKLMGSLPDPSDPAYITTLADALANPGDSGGGGDEADPLDDAALAARAAAWAELLAKMELSPLDAEE